MTFFIRDTSVSVLEVSIRPSKLERDFKETDTFLLYSASQDNLLFILSPFPIKEPQLNVHKS